MNTTLELFAVENAKNVEILEQFKTLTMTFVAKHLTYYKHQQFTPDCQIWPDGVVCLPITETTLGQSRPRGVRFHMPASYFDARRSVSTSMNGLYTNVNTD